MKNLVTLLLKTLIDPETTLKETSDSAKSPVSSAVLKVLLVLLIVVVMAIFMAILVPDLGDE